ncbi:bifunctional 3-phenylpropionate/cinnamic acid dioxygenase ferredoxin subunit [Pseudonocardia sp.]|jgi:3-phenylpropionate/trans-cinnamate dioxygenase ferredoxin subunit|uniref:bifunctional 3-phenylpropionate/cinnamic acid dioxygenase ferredoxin subunit n=1 Tax=Pseudonocardia sp. TaxID=60912 RepID=UPI0031FC310A
MIYACQLADLPRGGSLRLTDVPGSPPVALFHTEDGELYAVDDTCTHQDASLADGFVEDCAVECPLHAAIFDLRTGEADGMLAKLPIRTHRVMIEDGAVHVQVSEAVPYLPPGARRTVAS